MGVLKPRRGGGNARPINSAQHCWRDCATGTTRVCLKSGGSSLLLDELRPARQDSIGVKVFGWQTSSRKKRRGVGVGKSMRGQRQRVDGVSTARSVLMGANWARASPGDNTLPKPRWTHITVPRGGRGDPKPPCRGGGGQWGGGGVSTWPTGAIRQTDPLQRTLAQTRHVAVQSAFARGRTKPAFTDGRLDCAAYRKRSKNSNAPLPDGQLSPPLLDCYMIISSRV